MSDDENDPEQAMSDAIRGLVTEHEVALVVRSVTVAEVLLVGHEDSALTTVTTGDVPNWATIGMLKATIALAEAAHVSDAWPEDE